MENECWSGNFMVLPYYFRNSNIVKILLEDTGFILSTNLTWLAIETTRIFILFTIRKNNKHKFHHFH